MVNWLVAVDGSESPHNAFNHAIWLLTKDSPNGGVTKDVDNLFIVCVAEKIQPMIFAHSLNYRMYDDAQENIRRDSKKVLARYYKMAHQAGIKNVFPLLATSPSISEAILQAIAVKEIDTVIVGARGLGFLQSLFLGSVSKTIAEQAKCTVIIVKNKVPASEEHVSLEYITELEETERKRRMDAMKEPSAEILKQRSDLDRHLVDMAEEEERWRRIHSSAEISVKDLEKRAKLLSEVKAIGQNDTHYINIFEYSKDRKE